VTRQNVDGGAFAYYAVTTTDMTPVQLSWFIDNTVTKRLLGVPGVAQMDPAAAASAARYASNSIRRACRLWE
jgi:multidrug efflux pump subunit AcrB